MRRLLYVPIVHDEADLGTAGAALSQRSAALCGEGRWALHQEATAKFWQAVAIFLRPLDTRWLKVYQDGLPAAGEVGRRIVQEAARRGSRNYQLVLDLLDRGAELRRTENPSLLLQERERLLGLLGRSAEKEERQNVDSLAVSGDSLIQQRDKFIADTLNGTLAEGEVGVLFIGADHEVASLLDSDIALQFVKDVKKVRAYFEALLLTPDDERFAELASYLWSPVAAS